MSKKVYLDLGHGGSDCGAVGLGLQEADINLAVGLKVKKLLEGCGLSVKASRTSDATVSLEGRCKDANSYGANCFVSIHCNAFANSGAKGVETFAYTNSVSDLAKCVHNEILSSKAYTTNRGLKTANFYVLKHTKMRACLVELAFITNSEDNQILRNKQDVLAEAIARGICKYLKVEFKKPVTNTNKFYRVVVGSYSSKSNAEDQVKKLKASGFDSFIDVFEK